MAEPITTVAPKPFVFVLMPFDGAFDDIYKFGIKGAAEDAGAYAERVSEQIYDGSILDRILNQIAKADVLVADMSGKNANVFYEVGYAHALGKIVLLVTQNANDIPFDLRHRPHVIYGGKIESLRGELGKRIQWAIKQAAAHSTAPAARFTLSVNNIAVPEAGSSSPPQITLGSKPVIHIQLENLGNDVIDITHIYTLLSIPIDLRPTDAYGNRLEPIRVHETPVYGNYQGRYVVETSGGRSLYPYAIESIPQWFGRAAKSEVGVAYKQRILLELLIVREQPRRYEIELTYTPFPAKTATPS